jgi:hypothetical protein
VNTEKSFQLIGVMIFLIITFLTYYIMIPLSPETNSTGNSTTNTTTNTTSTTSEINPLTSIYRVLVSITSGGVIGIVTVSLLYSVRQN